MERPAIGQAEIDRMFAEYSGGLCLYARQWLDGNAEDAVQESFVKLLCCKIRPENVRAWLYRTVRNECISRLRKKQVRDRAADKLRADGRLWFQADCDSRLDAELVQQKLAELDESLREVVTLRLWGQLGFEEIAEITGVAVSTLHSRYHRAIDMLRDMLL